MQLEHSLPESFLRPHQPVNVLVVGAGGNGSAIFLHLPYLHQALRVWGHAGLNVTLVDGDEVSETNCVRQPFASADVGLNKAVVLANRVNLFWGLRWRAVPEHFRRDFLDDSRDQTHLLISCVDTRAARQMIAGAVTSNRNSTAYWLDLGNNAASGQYVLGQPRNWRNAQKGDRLRTVVELYPDIAAPEIGEDPLPSCSAIEALERQEPFINQVLATSALAMLSRLLRYGTISHHGAFFNATTGRMSIMPIDRDLWRKTQRRSLRLLKRSLAPPRTSATAAAA
jgi:PRTRC genetic system ThiF family protein